VDLKPGDPAPRFAARTHEGGEFRLEDRKGQWTVLYFYPWAGTSGCTRQADAFRDNIAAIRTQGAEVFGISTDTVESQAAFHEEEHLPFTLLADPEGAVATAYGAKMPILTMSRRWNSASAPEIVKVNLPSIVLVSMFKLRMKSCPPAAWIASRLASSSRTLRPRRSRS